MGTHRNKDAGQDQVDKLVDQELEQGYRGQKVDPTPNENYTVAGVLAGKPTPETENAGQPRTHTTTASIEPDVRANPKDQEEPDRS